MSSWRFELLLRFLHLNYSEVQPKRGQQGFDKLYKIRPFLGLLLPNFQSTAQALSVDESMINFKGWLLFLQYLPKKPQKWGMKAWVLEVTTSGCAWGWHLYTGKEEKRVQRKTSPIVLSWGWSVMGGWRGRIVYMDKFPALLEELSEKGFGGCGTVWGNRRGVLVSLRGTKLKKGEVSAARMVECWHWSGGTNGMLWC